MSFYYSYLGHGHVGLQLVYLLPQPRLKRAVYYEAARVIDSRGGYSDTPGGGLSSPLGQQESEITWVLLGWVRLGFCFALLGSCAECRDWGDTGDIYGFIGIYNRSFVISTCLLVGDDCSGVDVRALMLCFSKAS